jgi:hypothetical protein
MCGAEQRQVLRWQRCPWLAAGHPELQPADLDYEVSFIVTDKLICIALHDALAERLLLRLLLLLLLLLLSQTLPT